MAARLTDRQRKMIMADRAGEMSIRQLADKYHVSTTTIQRILKNNTVVAQMVTEKKKQNTLDMLAFMDSGGQAGDQVSSKRNPPRLGGRIWLSQQVFPEISLCRSGQGLCSPQTGEKLHSRIWTAQGTEKGILRGQRNQHIRSCAVNPKAC